MPPPTLNSEEPDMGARGELHYKAVRHAGDTPLEGFV